jgi:hypothetical protein
MVHQHRAGAAGSLTAAKLRSGQIEVVPEHRQQAVVRVAIYLLRAAVDPNRVGGHGGSLHLRRAPVTPTAAGVVRRQQSG